ncbi:unnamed protein product [Plutella xylostella]|uniref:(diamondback moth) hypothetical protein n=1 Tax=Plutella xylostella TaxID=51655 RepID=A0A8S4FT13_PLUXY|nr:unnamed protein product [Plutella xylostella]
MKLILLAATIAVASARPRYIALPSDQIAFVDLSSLHLRRAPRQTLEPPPPPPPQQQPVYQDYQEYQPQRTNEQYQPQHLNEQYQPIPVQQYVPQPIALAPQPAPARIVQNPDVSSAASQYESRPPDFGEYVDFGAHTGDNGAFGWYADYPINNHHDSYRRK